MFAGAWSSNPSFVRGGFGRMTDAITSLVASPRSSRMIALSLVLVAMALRAGGDSVRFAADPARYRDGEELLSASAGLFLWHTGWWSHTLDLQYKAFCGGCTVHSVTAAALLGLGGDSFRWWKVVPEVWSLVQLPLAFLALRALFPGRLGVGAGYAALALLALPPLGASDVGLMAWGNHAESGVFVLGALALVPSAGGTWLWAGLVAGLGVWFCRTTAYVLPLLFLLAGRGGARLLVGVFIGASPILLPAGRGEVGAYDAGLTGHEVGAIVSRLESLVRPEVVATRLWPGVREAGPLSGTWLLAAGAAVAAGGRRTWPVLVLAATFALGFAFADVDIPHRGGKVMNLRYHAPWFLIVPLLVAAAIGVSEGWRRRVAVGALALMLAANGAGRARGYAPPASASVGPTDGFRDFVSVGLRFAPEELSVVHAADPEIEAVARRMEGFALGASVLRGERSREAAARAAPPDVLAGLGAVLAAADPAGTAAWAAKLPPDTAAALTSLRAPLRLPPSLGGILPPR
ncbi:hypothetical protein LBMAG42_49640 [Deltaproteobacteria bacterium]|nr:hypothetical protein LBMAG42_49640 [Deltaproteobacteria bacterium]